MLELDGGGVRGTVQLKVLSRIQDAVGLPLDLFFDLAVGTSVGKNHLSSIP